MSYLTLLLRRLALANSRRESIISKVTSQEVTG